MHAHLLPLAPGSDPAPPAGTVASCRLDGDSTCWLLALTAAPSGAAYEVEDLFGCPGGFADVALVTEFDGPRDADQVAADRRANRDRVWPAAAQVEGTRGAVVLRGSDGGMVVVALAADLESLEAGTHAILSTPLLPGEQAARLLGPDRITTCRASDDGLLALLRSHEASGVTA